MNHKDEDNETMAALEAMFLDDIAKRSGTKRDRLRADKAINKAIAIDERRSHEPQG